ncbi:MAG: SDR family oxidoreductase [Anaerolineae bacterium]|nr:SDR family oxidoreductase [Anaerolineae bacterium]
MRFEGKTALITGAGRGIGKGCAIELARAGAKVIINDRPNSPDLQAAVTEIEALGGEAIAIEADVFSRVGCEKLMRETLAAVNSLDILVSNPAMSTRQTFLGFDPDLFERIIQATMVGGFHMSQLVARHMVERKSGGKIIFISSVHAEMPYTTAVAYNAAKAGLNHMAKTIARELVSHHINVNIIEPGWIDTPGEREAFGEDVTASISWLPWGRLGTPADIGKAVAFLASEDADYITGTILRVDGGYLHKDT